MEHQRIDSRTLARRKAYRPTLPFHMAAPQIRKMRVAFNNE
jgi:hypothetical protein